MEKIRHWHLCLKWAIHTLSEATLTSLNTWAGKTYSCPLNWDRLRVDFIFFFIACARSKFSEGDIPNKTWSNIGHKWEYSSHAVSLKWILSDFLGNRFYDIQAKAHLTCFESKTKACLLGKIKLKLFRPSWVMPIKKASIVIKLSSRTTNYWKKKCNEAILDFEIKNTIFSLNYYSSYSEISSILYTYVQTPKKNKNL